MNAFDRAILGSIAALSMFTGSAAYAQYDTAKDLQEHFKQVERETIQPAKQQKPYQVQKVPAAAMPALPAPQADVAIPPSQKFRYVGQTKPGAVMLDHKRQYLYFLERDGTATRYPIVVGREGFGMREEVFYIADKLPRPVFKEPGYTGSLSKLDNTNMLGVMGFPLVTVSKIKGDHRPVEYWMHGTSELPQHLALFFKPDGERKASDGCIRIPNQYALELARKVRPGTPVYVYYRGELDPVMLPMNDRQGQNMLLKQDTYKPT